MITFWRWYRWFPGLWAFVCLGIGTWAAVRGQWGWVGVQSTMLAVNGANAAFCHWQYRLAWYTHG